MIQKIFLAQHFLRAIISISEEGHRKVASTLSADCFTIRSIALFGFLLKMAAVLDEVGKSAEKLVNEEKDEIVDEEDEAGAVEASKKKKKKKKKKKAGTLPSVLLGV